VADMAVGRWKWTGEGLGEAGVVVDSGLGGGRINIS